MKVPRRRKPSNKDFLLGAVRVGIESAFGLPRLAYLSPESRAFGKRILDKAGLDNVAKKMGVPKGFVVIAVLGGPVPLEMAQKIEESFSVLNDTV